MYINDRITTIAFDADDTLWMNEPIFVDTQNRCKDLLRPYVAPEDLEGKLYATEKSNLSLFGYGIKGFILSMIETAIQLSGGKLTGREVQEIIDIGKEMMVHPVHLLETVEETITALSENYELMIITKGDLFDQENKIARSGIADFFDHVEIVSEKDIPTYRRILQKRSINEKNFMMVGNSIKSDILPILKLGGYAVHVPYEETWQHEQVESHHLDGLTYWEIQRLDDLLPIINPGLKRV